MILIRHLSTKYDQEKDKCLKVFTFLLLVSFNKAKSISNIRTILISCNSKQIIRPDGNNIARHNAALKKDRKTEVSWLNAKKITENQIIINQGLI